MSYPMLPYQSLSWPTSPGLSISLSYLPIYSSVKYDDYSSVMSPGQFIPILPISMLLYPSLSWSRHPSPVLPCPIMSDPSLLCSIHPYHGLSVSIMSYTGLSIPIFPYPTLWCPTHPCLNLCFPIHAYLSFFRPLLSYPSLWNPTLSWSIYPSSGFSCPIQLYPIGLLLSLPIWEIL